MKRVFFTAVVALLLALGLAAAGGATVPGLNGVIVFRAVTGDGSSQVFTIASDGSGQRQLTNLAGDGFLPHWSPESNRIVFEFDPANPVGNDFCNIATMNRNAVAHCKTAAAHYREENIPRGAAHAWSVSGHVETARALLIEQSQDHAARSRP